MSDYKVTHDEATNAISCLISYNEQMRQREEELAAERAKVAELEAICDKDALTCAHMHGFHSRDDEMRAKDKLIDKLEAQNKRMREALELYAIPMLKAVVHDYDVGRPALFKCEEALSMEDGKCAKHLQYQQ